MRAGKLREPIVIERRGGRVNENGEPLADDWVVHADTRADVMFLSGKEFVTSGAVRDSLVASMRIRYRDGIDASMRVRYDGQVFEIVAVLPNRAKRRIDLSVKTGEKYVSAGDRPE
ncbi:phage head closure protein [Burkholderia gladioli]|uniref:phage head closure protein n=1 Tax=Burkholderia gladioli TaxID=28095 RepID=UPI00163EC002|nr:phage head closure protein [Burkholderia gladioli]